MTQLRSILCRVETQSVLVMQFGRAVMDAVDGTTVNIAMVRAASWRLMPDAESPTFHGKMSWIAQGMPFPLLILHSWPKAQGLVI